MQNAYTYCIYISHGPTSLPPVCHRKIPMANESIPSLLVPSLTFPLAVKLSTKFANDLNEAEKATVPGSMTRVETISIDRPFTQKRALSNVSSTSSNDTTLVDEGDEQEKLSPAQSQACHNGGTNIQIHLQKIAVLKALADSQLGITSIRLRFCFVFRRLVSAFGFCKSEPQDENLAVIGNEVFVKEQCKRKIVEDLYSVS
jgi:hypothetical protein